MPERLREVMTPDPVTVAATASLQHAAELMRDRNIGDVLVVDESGALYGIVTDRDIVVAGIAEGVDPASTSVDEVCTQDPVSLGPDDAVAQAAKLMSDRAIRRLPVVDNGTVVGIVSLGDLAIDRDPSSVLGEISEAPPNN
ncbi:MAG: CBS domain-containing protein [Acidimicrobiia bacterium]